MGYPALAIKTRKNPGAMNPLPLVFHGGFGFFVHSWNAASHQLRGSFETMKVLPTLVLQPANRP